jgi:hypothetical protein
MNLILFFVLFYYCLADITKFSLDIIDKIIQVENPSICSIFPTKKIYTYKYLCNYFQLSPNYVIIPYNCIENIYNIFIIANNKPYKINYLIYDRFNDTILLNFNDSSIFQKKLLIKNNLFNNIIYNISDTKNKFITINDNITFLNKHNIIFDVSYPNIKLNSIISSSNISIINDHYYYFNHLNIENIDDIVMNINNYIFNKNDITNIYNNFNNQILTTFINTFNYTNYIILCIESQKIEILNITNITVCSSLYNIFDIYKQDLNKFIKKNIIYTVKQKYENNKIYFYDIINYDTKNCKTINII